MIYSQRIGFWLSSFFSFVFFCPQFLVLLLFIICVTYFLFSCDSENYFCHCSRQNKKDWTLIFTNCSYAARNITQIIKLYTLNDLFVLVYVHFHLEKALFIIWQKLIYLINKWENNTFFFESKWWHIVNCWEQNFFFLYFKKWGVRWKNDNSSEITNFWFE